VDGRHHFRKRIYYHRTAVGRGCRRHHYSRAESRKNKNVGAMRRHRRPARRGRDRKSARLEFRLEPADRQVLGSR